MSPRGLVVMRRSQTAWIAGLLWLGFGTAWVLGQTPAQAPAQPRANPTLLERLEDFTSAIFGTRESSQTTLRGPRIAARPAPSRSAAPSAVLAPRAADVAPIPPAPSTATTQTDSAAALAQRPSAQRSVATQSAGATSTVRPTVPNPADSSVPASSPERATHAAPAASATTDTAPAGPQPLHKRLAVLRETLVSRPADASATGTSPGRERTQSATSAPGTPFPGNSPGTTPVEAPAAGTAALAPASTPPLPSGLSSASGKSMSTSLGPALSGPAVVPPSTNAWGVERLRSGSPELALFNRPSPVLVVEMLGPRRIAINQEATYDCVVRNTGEVAAQEVTVSITVPAGIEVLQAETSAGSTSPAAAASGGQLQWRLGRLEAKGREKLTLRLIARQSRPFDLPLKWECVPTGPSNLIEVQEPRLAVMLHGPREVEFGKGELYKLEVQNTGTGDAENVRISLWTQGQSASQPAASHGFGKLAAGQKKSIDVELTARQEGKIALAIEARADGNLRAEISEEIVVRRAALKIEVEAPRLQYVGTEATCRVRVLNPGTAPAAKPVLVVTLPAGMRFISSPQTAEATDAKITWQLDEVPAGGQTVVTFVVAVTAPGTGRIEAQCTAQGGLTASATAVVQGEAAASLTLAVEEPTGPVAIGSDAHYFISIQNRGTAPAEHVDVVMYFSQGIEPVAAEGLRHRIGPGQVVFDVLPQIPAGQSVTLKVRARAETAGNHIFRVEVHSKAAGAHLVREGTTRFYGEAIKPSAVAGPGHPTTNSPGTAPH